LEDFTFETPKTKNFVELLKNFSMESMKTLVVVPENDANVYLSSRNLRKVKIMRASDLNTYEILDANRLLIMESSVKDIEKEPAS
jgi:large subunit ribosomal protein L4